MVVYFITCIIDGDTSEDYFNEEDALECNDSAYLQFDNDAEGPLQRLQITRYLAAH